MPLPLVLLHARSADLANPATSQALLALVAARSAHLAAAQLVLHRFVGAPSRVRAAFIGEVYRSCGDDAAKKEVRDRVAGQEGLLSVFGRDGLSAEAYQGAHLLFISSSHLRGH